MELLDAVVTASLLGVATTMLAFFTNGRFKDLKAYVDVRLSDMNQRFSDMNQRFDDLNRRVDELRDDIRGLRGDFTQLAFSIGGGKRPNAG